jgi:hypothetical protein
MNGSSGVPTPPSARRASFAPKALHIGSRALSVNARLQSSELGTRKMTYWLGVDTPEVWEEAQRKYNLNEPHPFGFPEGRRKSVQRMKIGDRIVNYITKRQRFFAVWEVTKGYIYDPTNTFANNKAFPECVEVSPVVRLAPEEGIENPGVSVRQSAVRLDDEVGERILSALRDRVPASELESDLQAINQQKTATERKQYIDARLGQGQFRTKLLERWGNRCAVTGNAVARRNTCITCKAMENIYRSGAALTRKTACHFLPRSTRFLMRA